MKIGPVAYKIALPQNLGKLHNVFHISQLKKYQPDLEHVIEYKDIDIQDDHTFVVEPEQIIDRQEKQLRHRNIPFVKVV